MQNHEANCRGYSDNSASVEVSRSYAEKGYRVLLAQEVRNNTLSLGDGVYMDYPGEQFIRANRLQRGDVVLTRSGANFGQCAPILTDDELYACADLLIIRKGDLPAGYLSTVLNTAHGRLLLDRGAYGMAQPHIAPTYVRGIPIPIFPSLIRPISAVIDTVCKVKQDTEVLLKEAEEILLQTLGLNAWATPEPLTYIRNSSEAFASGRLDAEHFQPKFSDLLAHLEKSGASVTLNSVLFTNQRGKQPEYAEAGLPVINSKHVLTGEVRLDEDNRKAVFDDKTLLIQTGDVLMNGTGVGTIGRCAPYLHETKAIPDNHVTILRPTAEVDPIYLSVFLNSLAGQMQVTQRLRGSSGQIELYPNDIAQFKVWVAPSEIQADIRQAVEKSFEQKQRATQLLEAAKRAVEIAIEQSEVEALAYLDDIAVS